MRMEESDGGRRWWNFTSAMGTGVSHSDLIVAERGRARQGGRSAGVEEVGGGTSDGCRRPETTGMAVKSSTPAVAASRVHFAYVASLLKVCLALPIYW
jgi:hypothetical protein